jgi:uncharacterized membrane protein
MRATVIKSFKHNFFRSNPSLRHLIYFPQKYIRGYVIFLRIEKYFSIFVKTFNYASKQKRFNPL